MSALTLDGSVKEFYDDVRSDKTETNWATFGYGDDNGGAATAIVGVARGSGGYAELVQNLKAGVRLYAFLRYISGDELSARAKFVFISWVPQGVPIRKRASVSTHKSFVKEVVKDFAIELHAEDVNDITEAEIQKALKKAGGANYGSSSS